MHSALIANHRGVIESKKRCVLRRERIPIFSYTPIKMLPMWNTEMHSLRKNHRFTIHRTLVVQEPFGTHKCVPYAHVGTYPVGRTRQTPNCCVKPIQFRNTLYLVSDIFSLNDIFPAGRCWSWRGTGRWPRHPPRRRAWGRYSDATDASSYPASDAWWRFRSPPPPA